VVVVCNEMRKKDRKFCKGVSKIGGDETGR